MLQKASILFSAEVHAAAVGRDYADIRRAARKVQRRAVLERIGKAAVDVAARPLDRHIFAAGHKVAGAAADQIDREAAIAVDRFHVSREDEQVGEGDRLTGRTVLIVPLILNGRVLAGIGMVCKGCALGGVERHLCGGGVGSALLHRVVREAQTGLVAAVVLGTELILLYERLHVRTMEKQRMLRAVLTAAGVTVKHGTGVAVAHTVEMVGIIGFHIAVSLLAAAGMDDDGVIRQGNAQIVWAQAADAADRLDVVQVAENRHHAGDAALSRDLIDDVCVADADLRLRVDNVIDHDGKRAGIFRLRAQLFAGERSVICLRF